MAKRRPPKAELSPREQCELVLLEDDIRRRQFRPKTAESMANLIGRLMARKGYGQEKNSQRYQQAWQSAVQELGPLGSMSRPGNLRNGVLEILVSHSAALQEFKFQEVTLLERVQQRLSDQGIRGLKFRVARID